MAPIVTIPKTTFTTANVEWTGIGADPTRFEISIKPVDGGEEKVSIRYIYVWDRVSNWMISISVECILQR